MALLNNQPIQTGRVTPEQRNSINDYLMKKHSLNFLPANGDPSLINKLSSETPGEQIAVTPIESRLSDMAMNPNRQASITDSLDYSKTVPSVQSKVDVPTPKPINPEVKAYVQKKMNPQSETSKPSEAKKEDENPFDWSYVAQGISSLGDAMRAGSGGASNQGQIASTFQGMRDSRDAKIEQAKLNDPNNEKAVEYRDFIKNNFNPKLLKDVDLNKMSLSDMQSMYGQIKDREGADLQRQMMMAKAGAGKSVKPPTENQAKAKTFGDRMAMSNKIISQIETKDDGYNPGQMSSFGMTPERWKSDDRKSYETAQSDWIQANLRKESGSAISDEEFSKNAKTYFPQAGDSPEILKQKAQLRGIMENNMKSEARPAYEYDIQFSAPRQPSNNGESVMRHPKTGKMYRVKDGKNIGEI